MILKAFWSLLVKIIFLHGERFEFSINSSFALNETM